MRADGLILAGGASRRMGGNHKGNLIFEGKTFQERIISELKKEAKAVWISYGREVQKEEQDCRIVMDIYAGSGPIGGIHAGLNSCEQELVMVASCDLPFLKVELYQWLYEELLRTEQENQRRYEGIVPMIKDWVHPLSAIYRKSAAAIAEEQIQCGNYRMRDFAAHTDILKVDVSGYPAFVKMFTNVNTLEDYERIQGR